MRSTDPNKLVARLNKAFSEMQQFHDQGQRTQALAAAEEAVGL